jgi:hypothetical protein
LPGVVIEEDLFTADLRADTVFAYLTPALLMRLGRRLEAQGFETRFVTPRYAVAGWIPSAESDGCFLYEVPAEPEGPVGFGWPARATLAVAPAGRRFLLPVWFGARTGAVEVEMSATLAKVFRAEAGLPAATAPVRVAVDLLSDACAAGSVVTGSLSIQGEEHTLAVVYADANFRKVEFSAEEGELFRQELRSAVSRARGEAA